MSTGTPKRVSFGGDQGSLVETLIIDDNPPSALKNGHMMTSEINGNARKMETPPVSPAKYHNSTSSVPSSPAKVEVRQEYMESHENPFTEQGELHKKAEHILRHSTISRTEVRINDPDTEEEVAPEQIEMMEAKTSSPTHAAPPPSDINGVNEQTVLKENGKTEVDGTAIKPKDSKKGKCKCCTIQ